MKPTAKFKEKEKKKKAAKASESQKDKQIQELKNTIKYLQADFENYKKHFEKEGKIMQLRANENIIRELLPSIDDFMRSVERVEDKDIKVGFNMILQNIMDTLTKNGLKAIEAKGEKFDPYYHEAVAMEKSEKDNGTVIAEIQKGYMLNSKVLRHSKVKISKKC